MKTLLICAIALSLFTFAVHAEVITVSEPSRRSVSYSEPPQLVEDTALTAAVSNGAITGTQREDNGTVLAVEATSQDRESAPAAEAVVSQAATNISDVVDTSPMTLTADNSASVASNDGGFTGSPASVVPEPSSLFLVGAILITIGVFGRKARP
jgi:hypothetical protein